MTELNPGHLERLRTRAVAGHPLAPGDALPLLDAIRASDRALRRFRWATRVVLRDRVPPRDAALGHVTVDAAILGFAKHDWYDDGPEYNNFARLRLRGTDYCVLVPLRPDYTDYGRCLAHALREAGGVGPMGPSAAELLVEMLPESGPWDLETER